MNNNDLVKELTYIEEHVTCLQYKHESSTGFRYQEFKKGECAEINNFSVNCIFFVLEGCFKVSLDTMNFEEFQAKQMICVPKNSSMTSVALMDAKVVVLLFDKPNSVCDKQVLSSYFSLCDSENTSSVPLDFNYSMNCFLKGVQYYLINKLNCSHMHGIKEQEFFLILRSFYPKESIAEFLWPVIKGLSDFKDFIEKNAPSVNSIKELIYLSHYSNSAFYRKFKDEYGDITPQNWLMQQKKAQMLTIASTPGMSTKEMMVRLNIHSLSTLKRICQRIFNTTPAGLIKSMQIQKR